MQRIIIDSDAVKGNDFDKASWFEYMQNGFALSLAKMKDWAKSVVDKWEVFDVISSRLLNLFQKQVE